MRRGWVSNEGRLVVRAASERQGALSSAQRRAFPKAVTKFWMVWSALGRAKPLGGGQSVVAFLAKVLSSLVVAVGGGDVKRGCC